MTRFYFPKFLPCSKTKLYSICTRISNTFFRKNSGLFSEVIFKVLKIILDLCAIFSIVHVVWCRLYVLLFRECFSALFHKYEQLVHFLTSQKCYTSLLFGLRISPGVFLQSRFFLGFNFVVGLIKYIFKLSLEETYLWLSCLQSALTAGSSDSVVRYRKHCRHHLSKKKAQHFCSCT